MPNTPFLAIIRSPTKEDATRRPFRATQLARSASSAFLRTATRTFAGRQRLREGQVRNQLAHRVSIKRNPLGWMVGAGIEYSFSDNWSAKIEYYYLDFGTRTLKKRENFIWTSGTTFSVSTIIGSDMGYPADMAA